MTSIWRDYFLSFLWFFITAILIFTLFNSWGYPTELVSFETDILEDTLLNSLMLFLAPAILFASILYLGRRGIVITLGVLGILLVGMFFINPLGLLESGGIIGISFTISIFLSFQIKRFSVQQRNTARLFLLFIIPLVAFIPLAIRVGAYQHPTASGCADLNVRGRSYCYARLAEQTRDPIWCYATGDTERCLQKLPGIAINPRDCQKLPNDKYTNSLLSCTYDSARKAGNISYCESQPFIGGRICISLFIKGHKRENTIDCSVLQNEDNKIICYKEVSLSDGGSVNSHVQQCDSIVDSYERDLCIFSNAYKNDEGVFVCGASATAEMSCVKDKAFFEEICRSIKSEDLRNRCVKSVDKRYNTVPER